jgi:hypothetical protein
VKPWSLFRKNQGSLGQEDVEGLLALDCPANEYDGEASMIQDRIAKATHFGKSVLEFGPIEEIVAEVWNGQFGPFEAAELERGGWCLILSLDRL